MSAKKGLWRRLLPGESPGEDEACGQTPEEEKPSLEEMVFVARQPVMDASKGVWGYELLFRGSGDAAAALVTDSDKATSSVIADGFVMAAEGLPLGRKVLINFPQRLLVEDAAFALPSDICVVEILEDVQPTPEVLAGLKRLKTAGYSLALDDYMGEEALEPFLGLVDIVKVDVLGLGSDREQLQRIADALHSRGVELLAEKVEDEAALDLARELGFSLFQGYFFSRPEVIPGRKVSASQISKLNLLQELSRPDFEVGKVSRYIQADLSLSYRLFRYINSVGHGVRHKVETVSRAVNLLGQRQLSQWLRAVLLSDLSPTRQAEELAFMSVHRARFLELAAEGPYRGKLSPERMFMLGLFSLLDALLGQPMNVVLEHVPLDDHGKSALRGEESPDLAYLDLVRSYERGHWEQAREIAQQVKLPLQTSDRLYMEAMVWTRRMFGQSPKEPAAGEESSAEA